MSKPDDFETIDYEDLNEDTNSAADRKPDDFIGIIVDKVYGFDWIILLAIAIAYLFVVSDLYGEHILSRFNGATRDGEITTYGYVVQLCSLLIGTVIGRIMLGMAR